MIGEAIAEYWTSPLPLGVLAVCLSLMGLVGGAYALRRGDATTRVRLLSLLYGLAVFFWSFLAVSLVLCISQAGMVAYRTWGVRLAFAGAVLASLALAFACAIVVWRHAPGAMLRRLKPRPLRGGEAWLQGYVDRVARSEGVPPTEVRALDSDTPIALSVGGRHPTVGVSRGLLALLEREELETVAAHELMHLKHRDAEFKMFSAVLARVLFFDPFLKFFDPAIQREREFLADEGGALLTRRPGSLARALRKIAGAGPPARASWGLSVYGEGRGLFSRYPPLEERVRRLRRLAARLAVPGPP